MAPIFDFTASPAPVEPFGGTDPFGTAAAFDRNFLGTDGTLQIPSFNPGEPVSIGGTPDTPKPKDGFALFGDKLFGTLGNVGIGFLESVGSGFASGISGGVSGGGGSDEGGGIELTPKQQRQKARRQAKRAAAQSVTGSPLTDKVGLFGIVAAVAGVAFFLFRK